MEKQVEKLFYAARWLLAPIYLGLLAGGTFDSILPVLFIC